MKILQIIKIMAKFLLISLLVLGLGLYSGCGSDGTGTGAGGPGGAGGGGAAAPPPLLAIVYVDDDASDGGDGTSWTKAFKDLQAGINDAAKKAEGKNGYVRVHVAVGTYKPTSRPNGGAETDPRTVHFTLKNNVKVNGGYKKGTDGTYTLVTVGENTPDADKTILSGDLGTAADTDNAYHVFYHPETAALKDTAKLSNVTITKANANDSEYNDDGGGMYNDRSSPSLDNVTFKDNKATDYGGGMINANNSNPTLKDVTFTGNRVSLAGGGMYNEYSSPSLTKVTFEGNQAHNGGGMANIGGSPTLNGVSFTINEATNNGGGMYNIGGSPTLNGVSFTSNEANSGGGMANRNSSPSLTKVTFTNNIATASGGGMYNTGISNPEFLSVCTFTGNTTTGADGKGGAIYNNKSSTITNPANAKDGSGKEITPTTDAASKDNGYYKATQ